MIISGKEASTNLYSSLKLRASKLKVVPTLAAILIGGNPASNTYLRIKQKKLTELGLGFKLVNLPIIASENDLLSVIEELNTNQAITGIILQLPLPETMGEQKMLDFILPSKDVDCLTTINLGKFFAENNSLFPATAKGVIRLFKYYDIDLQSKKVCVIGRSNLVTKPLALALTMSNATVTVCHSKTLNLKQCTLESDIVITGMGKANFLTKDYFRDGQILIDIGTSIVSNNSLSGDIDFENVSRMDIKITPVPGGVGPMTVYGLIENLILLAEREQTQI